MEQTKRRIVFKNVNPMKHFYIRSRVPINPLNPTASRPDYDLGPGMSVEALDDAEELQLASMSYDLVDVAKETPILANNMDALQRQLTEERAKNAALLAEKQELEKRVSTVKAVGTAKKR